MSSIVICPECLQGFPDVTLSFCVHDGSRLSLPVTVEWNDDEVETVVRSTPASWPSVIGEVTDDVAAKRKRTNPKHYLSKHFPELLSIKRRTSRPWLSSEKPEYLNNWWFNFLIEHIEKTDHILFVGALDREDRDFKLFKVPTSFLLANLPNIDTTPDGWVNLYISIESFQDLRHPSGISLKQFLIN